MTEWRLDWIAQDRQTDVRKNKDYRLYTNSKQGAPDPSQSAHLECYVHWLSEPVMCDWFTFETLLLLHHSPS